MDADIANILNPIIPTGQALKWQDVFKGVSISSDEDNTGIIYAIEEPETS